MTKSDLGRRVVLAGGSGFLGRKLSSELVSLGYEVVVLSRSASAGGGGVRVVQWDGETIGEWTRELEGACGVVNFAGRSIDCVPSAKNREAIVRSRVESTRVLGEAIEACGVKPRVWVQLSAVGFYGDTKEDCGEDRGRGDGFLSDVCAQWEASFDGAKPEGVRGVVVRAGVVLGRDDGAFPRLRRLARLGFGGRVGKGDQGMSWIHERDMTRILVRAVEDESMVGVYNGTAPGVVSNRVFMGALRRAVGMPIGPPAPAMMVAIGIRWVLRSNPALALEGQYARPGRLVDEGFEFAFGTIEEAFEDLCTKI